MSEKRLNEELSAVEAALASLKPAASGADRDRVMFLAGRVSANVNFPPTQRLKTQWIWPCTTAAALLLAIMSSSMLFLRGTAKGEKEAAYAKSNQIQTAENTPRTLWYEHARKETPAVNRPRPRPSSGRDNIPMDLLSLNLLIAEKGVEALPGPLWIPIGPEKYPRREVIMQDEWKMF
ncbi:MAG: hypothetical protein ABSA26_12530 [Thermoguttaceae bacterium]|jgi:hypothetical protein